MSNKSKSKIQAAVKKALSKSPENKALRVKKRKQPNLNPHSKENAIMDMNADLLLSELLSDPNIKAENIIPDDNTAVLSNQDKNEAVEESDLIALRKNTAPYANTKNKISQQERREQNGIKGNRSDSAEIMVYDIDLENDSDLVVLIKREINRMKITPNDIYQLIGSEECPFLQRKNDGWNLIYSLRTRTHITYENAMKWSVILNKRLITFIVDDEESDGFMQLIAENYPHLIST